MNIVIDRHNRRSRAFSLTSSSRLVLNFAEARRGSIHFILALVLAFLLAACTEYSQKFEEEYEFGPGTNRAPALNGESLTDLRDNFTYSVRKVGNLWWMMDDLAHPFFTDEAYKETYCYKDRDVTCDETGRLYPGEYLERACPKGWRLPSKKEWAEFFKSDVFKEYTPKSTEPGELYKGYVDGEHALNEYGGEAYYWANSNSISDSYVDCVHFKRDLSSSGGIEPDYSSFETATLCPAQWKLAVRCVVDVDKADADIVTSDTSSDAPYLMWYGPEDTEGMVNTGSADRTAGYWYACGDGGLIEDLQNMASFCDSTTNNGTSTFKFPADVKENDYGNFFGPLIETYAGIKGEIVFGEGYEYPYAYLAFNLVNKDREGVDISDWGGLCLVYESTINFGLELVPENEYSVTEYNNFKATVPTTDTLITVDLPWGRFKQEEGWGIEAYQSMVLSKTAIIRLMFKGYAGSSGDFYIRSIGRLGTCVER